MGPAYKLNRFCCIDYFVKVNETLGSLKIDKNDSPSKRFTYQCSFSRPSISKIIKTFNLVYRLFS